MSTGTFPLCSNVISSPALFAGLEWSAPGYIERVWNLAALSGVFVLHLPLEELLFALTFGFYWSSVYEHVTWRTPGSRHREFPPM